MNKKQTLFVADICGTLYQSITTFDYIDFVLKKKKKRLKWVVFKWLTAKWSPLYWGLAVVYKMAWGDVPKAGSIFLLKGFSKKELYELGHDFYTQFLQKKQIAQAFTQLEQAQKSGARLILASATIDPVAQAIAQALKASCISSQLAFNNQELCNGKMKLDMTGKKHLHLSHYFKENVRVTVMTDNFSDKALMQAADRRIAIIKNENHKAFWKDLEVEYIKDY